MSNPSDVPQFFRTELTNSGRTDARIVYPSMYGHGMCVLRWFPIIEQRVPHIPWADAELAYKVYSEMNGDSQSLERIAERGGFGLIEYQALRGIYELAADGTHAYSEYLPRPGISMEFRSSIRRLQQTAERYYHGVPRMCDRGCPGQNYSMRDIDCPDAPPPGPYVSKYFVSRPPCRPHTVNVFQAWHTTEGVQP